jgi:hypothetical protein
LNGVPTLSGLWLAAYRLAWAIALAGAVAAVVVDQLHALAPVRLLHALLLVAAAVILFRRRTADPVSVMLSLAFLLWAATRALEGEFAAALLDKLRFALFVTGMMLFPSGRFAPRWTLHAMIASWAVALFGMAGVLGLAPGAAYTPLSMTCAALAVLALRRRFLCLPPGVQRQQIKWVALGLAAGLALVAVSRVAGIALFFDAGVIAIVLGMLAALLRFRLYDADAAISRSTAYAALTVALLASFAASETLIQTVSQDWLGGSAGAVSGGVAAALAAGLMAPLHWRVTNWAEAHFQKRLTALRRDLPPALADLAETVGPYQLAEAVLDHIEPAVRASRAAVLLNDRVLATRHIARAEVERWAAAAPENEEDPRFSCCLPLRLEGAGLIGWLLVGPRPDGSAQGKDEREALAEMARPVARALSIATRRSEDKAVREHLLAELDRFVELLRSDGQAGDSPRPVRDPCPDAFDPGGGAKTPRLRRFG